MVGRECFIAARAKVEQAAAEDALKIDEEKDYKIQPHGEYELFRVDHNQQERQVWIGKKLPEDVQQEVQTY